MPRLTSLHQRLRTALQAAAEAVRAAPMQAYMKSAMPYHGVTAAGVRAACREVFATYAAVDLASWSNDVLAIWNAAGFREERYGAIALTGHRSAKPLQTPAALAMYEHMITTGAWWDYVDDIAVHRIGPLVATHPGPMKKAMLSWSRSPDLWKRRTSIICQVLAKDSTDLKLLYACIEPSLASKEFFLRKAIGWALRSYAWHDADEVIRYVDAHADRLSGLSTREALKNIQR